jgi:hypothetical protein
LDEIEKREEWEEKKKRKKGKRRGNEPKRTEMETKWKTQIVSMVIQP